MASYISYLCPYTVLNGIISAPIFLPQLSNKPFNFVCFLFKCRPLSFLFLSFFLILGIITITVTFTTEILLTFVFLICRNTMTLQSYRFTTMDKTPHILNISCHAYPDIITTPCVANRKIMIIWYQFRPKLLQNFFHLIGFELKLNHMFRSTKVRLLLFL